LALPSSQRKVKTCPPTLVRLLPFYISHRPNLLDQLLSTPSSDPDGDGWDELALDVPIIPLDARQILYDERFTVDNSSRWVFGTSCHSYEWDTVNRWLRIVNNSGVNCYDFCYVKDINIGPDRGVIIEADIWFGDSWGGITLNGRHSGYVDCNASRIGPRHVMDEYNEAYGSGGTIIYDFTTKHKAIRYAWNRVAVVFIPPDGSPTGKGRWWVFINGWLRWCGEDFDDDFYATYPGIVTNYYNGTENRVGRFVVSVFNPSRVSYVPRKTTGYPYKILPFR